jgi:hypothetical protein
MKNKMTQTATEDQGDPLWLSASAMILLASIYFFC